MVERNGNGEEHEGRVVRPPPPPPAGPHPAVVAELARKYASMAAEYQRTLAVDLPKLTEEIDQTKGAALAAAGHAQHALEASKRAEVAAEAAERVARRTELAVKRLATALLGQARAAAQEVAEDVAEEAAEEAVRRELASGVDLEKQVEGVIVKREHGKLTEDEKHRQEWRRSVTAGVVIGLVLAAGTFVAGRLTAPPATVVVPAAPAPAR